MTDTTKAPELKPCPICGKPPGEPVDATRILGSWRIVHRGCLIPNFAIERCTLHDAVSAWNGLSDHSDALIAAAREDGRREAAHLMPRYFGVWSSTGVHIGIWEDGAIAAKVLEEYPGGVVRDLIDAAAILALITKDQANG